MTTPKKGLEGQYAPLRTSNESIRSYHSSDEEIALETTRRTITSTTLILREAGGGSGRGSGGGGGRRPSPRLGSSNSSSSSSPSFSTSVNHPLISSHHHQFQNHHLHTHSSDSFETLSLEGGRGRIFNEEEEEEGDDFLVERGGGEGEGEGEEDDATKLFSPDKLVFLTAEEFEKNNKNKNNKNNNKNNNNYYSNSDNEDSINHKDLNNHNDFDCSNPYSPVIGEEGPLRTYREVGFCQALLCVLTYPALQLYTLLSSVVPAGGTVASTLQLLSATLGASALAIPFAFKEAGLVMAVILMLVGGVAAFYSIHLLAYTADMTGKRTYEELVEHVYGKKVELLNNISIIIFTWGSTVAYLIVIGDTMPPLLDTILGSGHGDDDVNSHHGVLKVITSRWFLMLFFTCVVAFPLALLKNLSSLRFTSALGFLAILYLVFVVLIRTVLYSVGVHDSPTAEGEGVEYLKFTTGFFQASPIIFYAYSSHVNIFSIYHELRRPTPARINTVIGGDVILAFLVYGSIGLCGYITFLSGTDGNIINNYDSSDIPVQVGSFLITIAVLLNIPLNTHPCRITIDWMLFGRHNSSFSPALRYWLETIALVYVSLLIAITVPSITVVFGLLGATATSLCCYIMPGLLYLKLMSFNLRHPGVWPAIVLVVLGTLSGITSTIIIIIDLIR